MDKLWHGIVTLSIVHFMAYPACLRGEGPVVETVQKLAEDPFFDALEIGWIKDAQARKQVQAICEQAHVEIGHAGQPALLVQGLDLNSPDPDMRGRALAQLKASIDEAAEMGSRRVAFLSGKDPGPERRREAKKWLLDVVLEASAYARQRGLEGLTLESFDRVVDKRALLGPSEETAAFAAEVRRDFPEFGILYDLSHLPLLEETPAQALGQLQDYLVHAHVGNCVRVPGRPGYGDLHPRFGFPGGENDVPELAEFLRALFDIGYLREDGNYPDGRRPWVGFEVKPQDGEDSELIIANAKRVWQQAWAVC